MSQAVPRQPGTSQSSKIDLQSIYLPVLSGLKAVDSTLMTVTHSDDQWLDDRLNDAGLESGKRIRPALLLLSGATFGDLKKTHIAAAAALELVHAATLVHDDVLDEAQQRRHVTSMNSRWDNKTSILTGDYLFSKAFEVGCGSGSLEAVRRIAHSSCQVCTGEVNQNARAGDFEVTEAQYTEIIALKTAELCRCACGLGALLSERDQETVLLFEQYGENLGIAFQIIDDVLDLVGKPGRVGKTLGTDLLNQKMTLPLIHALSQLDGSRKAELLDRMRSPTVVPDDVLPLLAETGSIEYARAAARNRATAAFEFADTLPRSEAAGSLCRLAEFVIERTH